MRLREVIEDVETGPGKVFDIAVQLLIVLSLICFSLGCGQGGHSCQTVIKQKARGERQAFKLTC